MLMWWSYFTSWLCLVQLCIFIAQIHAHIIKWYQIVTNCLGNLQYNQTVHLICISEQKDRMIPNISWYLSVGMKDILKEISGSKMASEVPIIAQQKWTWLVYMRIPPPTRVPPLPQSQCQAKAADWSWASLSGLRIQCCHGLWYKSQMWLRSGGVVAVV